MMSRRIVLSFDHPPCGDIAVDIHVSLCDPIQEGAEAIAERLRPVCPICKQPAIYVGFCFEPKDDL